MSFQFSGLRENHRNKTEDKFASYKSQRLSNAWKHKNITPVLHVGDRFARAAEMLLAWPYGFIHRWRLLLKAMRDGNFGGDILFLIGSTGASLTFSVSSLFISLRAWIGLCALEGASRANLRFELLGESSGLQNPIWLLSWIAWSESFAPCCELGLGTTKWMPVRKIVRTVRMAEMRAVFNRGPYLMLVEIGLSIYL